MLSTGMMLSERYELLEQIGTGGMSVVFKGLDHKLNRTVAVKVMREDFLDDPVQVEKFRKEARAVACLSHLNIVGVYDIGTEQGYEYMVKEYVDGFTLKEYIRRRRHLDSAEIVKISLKIAEGLRAAHEQGIIHRDIKPQNIMVTPKGEVKVTDFGIAKFATASTLTDHAEAMGSVHYISPEQARGEMVDSRSDLYSLGITMFEMAAVHPPFDGETPVAVAMKQITEPLPSLRKEEPNLWPGLEMIISGLTRKKPEERYQSAKDLIRDLKKVYQDPGHRAIVDNRIPSADIQLRPKAQNTVPSAAGVKRPDPVRKAEPINSYSSFQYDFELGEAQPASAEHTAEKKKQGKAASGNNIGTQQSLSPALIPAVQISSEPFHYSGDSKSRKEKTADKQTKHRKNTIAITLLAVLLGVLIFALGMVIIRTVLLMNDTRNATYRMPSFVGMTRDEVERTVSEKKYSLVFDEDVTWVYSDSAPEGTVTEQTPTVGTQLKVSEIVMVKLVVSKGPKPENMVEQYIGSDYENAISDLSRRNILYKVEILETEDDSKHGVVIGQYPLAGEIMAEDTTVILTVAYARKQMATVPNLAGSTEEEARLLLEKNHLRLGAVTEAYHPSVPEGEVIAQNMDPGKHLAKDSIVSITISMGPYEGSETQVEGAYLLNEELLGRIKGQTVSVYAWAVVDGKEVELLNEQYDREQIVRSNLYLKYYKGTTEIHVFADGDEVFSQYFD